MTPKTLSELSVRDLDVDGPVATRVKEEPPRVLQGKSRAVIFVHGYNNTRPVAREYYAKFTTALEKIYGESGRRVRDFLVAFHWPGDANLGPISFASYPLEISDAKASAEKLAAYLRELQGPNGGPIQLDFVAHSLGCRMFLETIRELLSSVESLTIRFGVVCLMAAAVQVDMLELGERLGGILENPQLFRRLLILHSTGDDVLHYAFPLGQTLAWEGFFPTALGRFGPPHWVPGNKEAVNELNHGEYWWRKDSNEQLAAYHVARQLDLGVVPLQIPSRSMVEHRTPGGVPLTERPLPEHHLPEIVSS